MASIDHGMLERGDSTLMSRMNSTVSYLSTTTDDDEFEDLPLPISELDQEFLDGGVYDESIEVPSRVPFKKIHDKSVPFDYAHRRCFQPGQKIHVEILKVEQPEISSLLNPNLYVVKLRHGDFQWQVNRRYKHFRHLHERLMVYRATMTIPVPTKTHKQKRKDFQERKSTLPRFPKRPDPLVKEENMGKRKENAVPETHGHQLEAYLQNVLRCSQFRNHPEMLKFLEVSHLSFVYGLGEKFKEGMVRKKAGGRRWGISCCSCAAASTWNESAAAVNTGIGAATPYNMLEERWLILKDSFVAYVNPQSGTVNDVLLMDHEFSVKHGLFYTGIHHGLVVSNLSRRLTLKCWTQRKAREWDEEIQKAMDSEGQQFMDADSIRYKAFAPERPDAYVNWFVDGASYMDAVADALEGAKEEIFITDWWLTPEIYLKRPITEGERWRLDFILKRKAADGVKIFVLLYKEMEMALGINSFYTKEQLQKLHPTNVKVLRHPDGINLWSHHEKSVIIDQRIAFLGGIDLCYGRWDTRAHRLTDLGDLAIVENKKESSGDIKNFIGSVDLDYAVGVDGMREPVAKSRRARFSTIQERTEEETIVEEDDETDAQVFVYPDVHRTNSLEHRDADKITINSACTTSSSDLPGLGIHRLGSGKEPQTEESCLDSDEESRNSSMISIPRASSTTHRTHAPADNDGSYINHANSDTESLHQSQEFSPQHTTYHPLASDRTDLKKWATLQSARRTLSRSESIDEGDEAVPNANNNANSDDKPKQRGDRNTADASSGNTTDSTTNGETSQTNRLSTRGNNETTESSVVTNQGEERNGNAQQTTAFNGDESADCDNDKPTASNSAMNDSSNIQSSTGHDEHDGSKNAQGSKPRRTIADIMLGRSGSSERGSLERGDSGDRMSAPGSVLAENSPTKTVLNINKTRPKSLADVARLLIDQNKEPDEPKPFKDYLRNIAMQVMDQQRDNKSSDSNGVSPDLNDEPSQEDDEESVAPTPVLKPKKGKKIPKLHLNMPHMTGRRASKASNISSISEDDILNAPGGKLTGPLADVVMQAMAGHAVKPSTPKSKRKGAMNRARELTVDFKERFRKNKSVSVDITEDFRPFDNDVYRRKEEERIIDPDAIIADLGLEGAYKTWLGKDYVNFIFKDLHDVDQPFTDLVDRRETPRMPWHDIGAVVYGKPARDVARHFIQRWNYTKLQKHKKNPDYPLLLPKAYGHVSIPSWVISSAFNANCQILRSACEWSVGISAPETSIHDAYIHLIENAKHYIYIENQFFISIAGHGTVKNGIANALYKRIIKAFQKQETFRVYVIMPLLPAFEGQLGTSSGLSIQAVIHWNYLSLSRGGRSLLRRLVTEGKIPDPFEYVTFYGLRRHEECLGNLMSELVYVHCKIMIVDDEKAIIGSANINDRSMVGSRDSELAILVEDTKKVSSAMNGKPYQAGVFSLSLRKTLMREHLGVTEENNSFDVTDPVSAAFYKTMWLNQASINTSVYDKVFNCVPTDAVTTFKELKIHQRKPIMAKTDPEKAKECLVKVKGQLVLMPLQFLVEEKLAPGVTTKEGLAGLGSIWT